MMSIEFDYSIAFSTADALRQVSLMLLLVLSFAPALISKPKAYSDTFTIKLFIAYMIFCLMSVFWSFSASETFVSCIGIFICFITSINIFRFYSYRSFLKSFISVFSVILILSWLLYFAGFRDYVLNKEDFFRFKGVFVHTQRLSIIAAACIISLLVVSDIFRKKQTKIFLILLLSMSLMFTKARAYITFTILCAIVVNFKYYKKYLSYMLPATLIFIILLFTLDFSQLLLSFYQRGDSDLTDLTGRTFVWEALIPMIEKRPWGGYGLGAFKLRPVELGSYIPTHAHNIWLHQSYETGILGAIIFTSFLISTFWLAFRFRKKYGDSLILYITIFICMAGVTGVPIGANPSPLYFFYLICIYYEGQLGRDQRVKPNLNASRFYRLEQK